MENNTEWVKSLVEGVYFEECEEHSEFGKKEKNMFCIDCQLCCCKNCIASSAHSHHRSLQICKYVYQHVVRRKDAQNHLDCSHIQTYMINGAKAVHLKPRPPNPKSSTKSKSDVVSCEACGRHIQDPNTFCSIACKVSKSWERTNKNDQETINVATPDFSEQSVKKNYDSEVCTHEKESNSSPSQSGLSEEKPRKRVSKRKDYTPRRAPFF